MADAWFETALTHPSNQAAHDQRALTIVHSLLCEITTPEQAAAELAAAYDAPIRKGNTTSVYGLWRIYTEAAARAAEDKYARLRMVWTLKCLAGLPDVLDGKGEVVRENGRVFWRELPELGFCLREGVIEPQFAVDDFKRCKVPSKEWDANVDAFANAHAFAALCVREFGAKLPPQEGLLCFALWHLSETLEVELEGHEGRARHTMLYLPAAAQWIAVAGGAVHKACCANALGSGKKAQKGWIGGGYGSYGLWDGGNGFSVERWRFWRKRLRRIAKVHPDEAVRKMAENAAVQMDRFGCSD
ncbi:uncharacterized protein K452DRAFT_293272 [Aplosporella prunicola CBS 121167]|uniref:Uncharacterized protein n=1 Tax=Aplosporella prunicola CBS 121167 TaxID=1176127 RepID=A0A6A6AVV8_9PEZI|nr:uncharacterized protein K452DRAFT_293272 [Aplosporella prunicola CBS 121167]KAF2135368.1 hypothetical protein K452DRAFT_293272 [Aplosporella prunicola CBS 121167]